MKRTIYLMIALTMILAMAIPAAAGTGNDLPSGPHYNLNIIGVSKGKSPPMENNGHRIFVPLWGKASIWLKEGEDFQVLDANGTDGNGASFQLPNPDVNNDGITEYSVFARALGKPGGWSRTTTCAYDLDNQLWCSVEAMVLVRDKGNQKFENVSKALLYVYADLNGDGVAERYPLFSDEMINYFWDYDNSGLKLAQLRFYDVETDVNQ